MTNNVKDESSGWKEFLNFLWDGGFKSLIVLATIVGAVLITLNNERVCLVVITPTPTSTPTPSSTPTPTSTQTPNPTSTQTQTRNSTSTPSSTPTPTRNSTSTPTPDPSTTSLIQPNPICSKYFELAFMVLGGYLGLSTPSSVNSNSKTKKDS